MSGAGQRLYAHARRRIPGGTQLLSKRPEMLLPERWPSYYSRASGAEIWDLDGHRYLDMCLSGIGACVLGYADPDVDAAARAAIDAGVSSTLNPPEEVELADLLCELHPWAEMVRFARGGGEAMAIAVRIARAHTSRDVVAFCGYHGWHDWYLAANLAGRDTLEGHLLPGLSPRGVPRGLAGTALPFHYNRLDELQAIVAEHGERLGAIVMEPLRERRPDPGFLEGVRSLADETGAVLVFDEVSAGFRLCTGGAHLVLGVTPDLAVFSKGMSNGYPMAAVIGCAPVMEAAQSTFISSTYWTDRIGPAAALATIRKHRDHDVATHLVDVGGAVHRGWSEAAAAAGIEIDVLGIEPIGHFTFASEHAPAARTLFTQLMLERDFLATPHFYAMFAHSDEHVAAYLAALGEVFQVVARALASGTVDRALLGPKAHAGFTRLA